MANKRGDSARLRRKVRVRKNVVGTDERPRVCVFRSNNHV
jgi:large subunit ribosomal protein L18